MINLFKRKILQIKEITQPEIPEAYEEAGMMVHGSGPRVVGLGNLRIQHNKEITEMKKAYDQM